MRAPSSSLLASPLHRLRQGRSHRRCRRRLLHNRQWPCHRHTQRIVRHDFQFVGLQKVFQFRNESHWQNCLQRALCEKACSNMLPTSAATVKHRCAPALPVPPICSALSPELTHVALQSHTFWRLKEQQLDAVPDLTTISAATTQPSLALATTTHNHQRTHRQILTRPHHCT